MSREMTMKLNQILYQRSRDWIENRPRTGILDALKRAKPDSVVDKGTSSFDTYLRGHIKTSNKTINIRGLFRVPDVTGGERLMIDAEEKEEKEQEQILQLPMSSANNEAWNRLSGMPNEPLPNVSEAMMFYPTSKPKFPEPEIIDVEEKQPIDYYIDLAKQQPGKKLAIIYKGTSAPRMGITYDGSKVKISSGGLAMEPNYAKEGVLKKTMIDKIYSIKYPPKFTQKDLPPDVEFKATTYYSSDDDEDPDKGGQKILSKKRKEKNEPEEEEKIPYSYSGKPKDDDHPDGGGDIILTMDKPSPDDDDEEHSFITARDVSRKNSDDYRLEIALLESEKEKLMKEIEAYKHEVPLLEKHNQDLVQRSRKLQEEVDLLRDVESSAKKDYEDMKNEYENQKKEIENMGLEKKDLNKHLRELKIKHREEIDEWKRVYKIVVEESRVNIEDYSKAYEMEIRKLQNEIKGLRENTEEKDYQINQLNKGLEAGNAHMKELQEELNDYKRKYYNLEVKENKAKNKIQQLERNVQDQSANTFMINDLKEYIREIEPKLEDYKKQIEQKENELKGIKQSAVEEHNQILEASRQELMNIGNEEHNRILSEKDKEMQELKEKNLEMEEILNRYKKNYPNDVKREVIRLTGKVTADKDQEIKKLQEQINQLLNQEAMQKTEMEEELPKIQPERIEIEENKQEISQRQGMQTRSQGPVSFGEQIQQEIFDPQGNLTWKGSVYKIPNMRDYGAYEVVVNLLSKGTGDNKIFKTNFVNYAKEVEKDLRS